MLTPGLEKIYCQGIMIGRARWRSSIIFIMQLIFFPYLLVWDKVAEESKPELIFFISDGIAISYSCGFYAYAHAF